MMRCMTLYAVAALGIGAVQAAQAQDIEAGQAVFKTQCSACHSLLEGKNVVGPSLFGIVGRPAGQGPGFHYSQANKDSGLIWNAETLDRYLVNPRETVPKTIMAYAGLKDPEKRANLIAYLSTVK